MRAGRVLFLYPPFGALSFPSVGLSILKRALERDGIGCDIRYLNFDLLDALPGTPAERLRAYDQISQRNDWCVGDWIFGGALFGDDRGDDDAFRAFLRAQGATAGFIDACFAVRALADGFVDRAICSIPWDQYAIVGFHSIFSQTVAGLAIAKRLKERHPSVVTLFGGPGAQGELGVEIVRQFPQIDYVLRGEADCTLPSLVRRLFDGSPTADMPGLVHRSVSSEGVAVLANDIAPVQDMNSVPVPDFDDYFRRFAGSDYEPILEVFLPIENSRGCWWGAKHHCTFCGIEDAAMAFRKKSPERVLEDIDHLVGRYDVRSFRCVDDILDMGYYTTLLPRLADKRLGLRMFHEVKANVKAEHMDLLARAGITLLQPGLEHLSTDVLHLMRKGTTYLQNVQFLKWARERDMIVFWSVLYGFPGERWDWYAPLPERMRSLCHLFPPKGAVRVRIDRFSPLFTSPRTLGLTAIRPTEAYRHVFPFAEDVVGRLAYHFDGDYADRDSGLNDRISAALSSPIAEWNDRYFRRGASLDWFGCGSRVLIRDTREDGPCVWAVLEGAAAEVIRACEAIRARSELAACFGEAWRGGSRHGREAPFGVDADDLWIDVLLDLADGRGDRIVHYAAGGEATLDAVLDRLVVGRLLATENGRYLSLACAVAEFEELVRRPVLDADGVNLAAARHITFEGVEGLTVA